MNISVYLFGKLDSIYTQYPNDHTTSIFKKFLANAKSTTQIAIHRDSNLMYYGYIWKLQQEKYIGLCVVLNGLLLNRIDILFSLYEQTISNLIKEGKLVVNFNCKNNPIISVEKLYQTPKAIKLLAESLQELFNILEPYAEPLPAVNFGTLKDSSKDFVVDDNLKEIVKSSYTNGYTYILKDNIPISQAQEQPHKTNIITSKPGMFRNPFSFTGRIRRTEYWLSMIIYFIADLFISIVDAVAESDYTALYVKVFKLTMFWFILAQGAKRCHDIGKSGWYQIMPLYGFWMLFAKGETRINGYGNCPK